MGVSHERGTPVRGARARPKGGLQIELCTGGPDVIRKEAWPLYRTISGVRLCWELEEPKGFKGRCRPCCSFLNREGSAFKEENSCSTMYDRTDVPPQDPNVQQFYLRPYACAGVPRS